MHSDLYRSLLHFDQKVVVVDAHISIEISGRVRYEIGASATAAGDEVGDPAVFVVLVVVNMAAEDDETGAGVLLALFEPGSQRPLGRPGGMAATEDSFVGRTGVGRMVENEKNEIDVVRNVVELPGEPRALRAGEFREGAVQDKHERVGDSYGIEAISAEVRKTLKIVGERGFFIALEVVIAKSRIDGDFTVAPDCSFGIPNLPVLNIVASIDNVATDGDEEGMFLRGGGDQGVTNRRIGRLSVRRIVEARVAESNEAKGDGGFNVESNGRLLGERERSEKS